MVMSQDLSCPALTGDVCLENLELKDHIFVRFVYSRTVVYGGGGSYRALAWWVIVRQFHCPRECVVSLSRKILECPPPAVKLGD